MGLTSLNSVEKKNLNVSFVCKFSLIAYKALKFKIAFLITKNTHKKTKHFLKKHRSFSKSTLKLMNLQNSDKSLNEINAKLFVIFISCYSGRKQTSKEAEKAVCEKNCRNRD